MATDDIRIRRRQGVRRVHRPGEVTVRTLDVSRGGVSTEAYDTVMRDFGSRQLVDPFEDFYQPTAGEFMGIEPPVNPYALMKLPQENNVLRQCIDAMVVNCDAFGYHLEYVGPEDGENSKESEQERVSLTGFLDQPNEEYGLGELRQRMRKDRETFGFTFTEAARDRKKRITRLYHLPGQTVRMTNAEPSSVSVPFRFMRGGEEVQVIIQKHFRRFVQKHGGRNVFFKEFGDPRTISPVTGLVAPNMSVSQSATEVVHWPLYDPSTPYGLPRWINQLPSILGSREAELTNLRFFKDNAIPAMAVLVSGGMLTAHALQEIEDHFYRIRGRDAVNRVMIIEAVGDQESASVTGQVTPPKLEIKTLAHERQTDQLFQEYDKNSIWKIRGAFRLPPMFHGQSDDYTRATAEASMVVAESQVFFPEREAFDEVFNTRFLSRPKYWRYRSNQPRMFGAEAITNALEVLDSMGGMTPNVAIGITNELFGLRIHEIKEEWGDYPFDIARDLANQGKLKGLEALEKDLDENQVPQDPETAGEAGDPTMQLQEDKSRQSFTPEQKAKLARVVRRTAAKRLRGLRLAVAA